MKRAKIISNEIGSYDKEDYSCQGYLINKALSDIAYRVKKLVLNMPAKTTKIQVDKEHGLFTTKVLILKVNDDTKLTAHERLFLNKIKISYKNKIEKVISVLNDLQQHDLHISYEALESHRQRCILAEIDSPHSELYSALNMKQKSLFGVSLTLFSGNSWGDIINGDSDVIKKIKQFDLKHLRQIEWENSPDYFHIY